MPKGQLLAIGYVITGNLSNSVVHRSSTRGCVVEALSASGLPLLYYRRYLVMRDTDGESQRKTNSRCRFR